MSTDNEKPDWKALKGYALRQAVDARLAKTDELIADLQAELDQAGIIYDKSKWVTIKEYCRRHNITHTNTVSNWIARGIIPPEDVRDFPDLNDLRLIRDKIYRTTDRKEK